MSPEACPLTPCSCLSFLSSMAVFLWVQGLSMVHMWRGALGSTLQVMWSHSKCFVIECAVSKQTCLLLVRPYTKEVLVVIVLAWTVSGKCLQGTGLFEIGEYSKF